MISNAIEECRQLQSGVIYFMEMSPRCEKYLDEKKATWAGFLPNKTLADALEEIELLDKAKVIPECATHAFKTAQTSIDQLLLNAYNDCLFATLLQMDILADFDRYRVNRRKADPEVPMGPIARMLKDTEESIEAIKKNLLELEDRSLNATEDDDKSYWSQKVGDFAQKLKGFPYDKIWANDPKVIIDEAKIAWDALKMITKDFAKYPFHEYRADIKKFNTEIGNSENEDRWKKINEAWTTHLKVDEVAGPSRLNVDPIWDYDLSKPLQKLRVGWDYLDKISEEIKCHLRISYWFDLRNETLQKTQVTWEKERIFGHFSRTLYQTCRTNDTDIIGRCNLKNHEMCRPMIHSAAQEDYIAETGDFSIYRPKWVFLRIPQNPDGARSFCKEQKTWIIPLNVCRCGVRMDCGKDLGTDLKCPLQPNDDVRKQCKGSIGYPCKSLPFAPGRHDASCIFSYCDMSRNSCEEDRRNFKIIAP